MTEFHLNRRAQTVLPYEERESPVDFHRSLPGYSYSSLRGLHSLAEELGIGRLWVKEESDRFGLPAYKILGASWAIAQRLRQHLGAHARDLDELRRATKDSAGPRLIAATDGNHGRAVARVAAWLGLDAEIVVPGGMSAPRIAAIRSEGAHVQVVDGSYDEAVRLAAALAEGGGLLIQDTAWPGYERVPEWIVDGYETIFREAAEQLAEQGEEAPALVLIQMGVGSLAAAAVRYFRGRENSRHERIRLIGVEPLGADCLLRSARAGQLVSLPGPHPSAMAGLNCGTPSQAALPLLMQGMDAFLAIGDELTFDAMRRLARQGVVAGESGAAGLAGLLAIGQDPALRDALGIDEQTGVLVVVTEADTDPDGYRRVVGLSAREVQGRE